MGYHALHETMQRRCQYTWQYSSARVLPWPSRRDVMVCMFRCFRIVRLGRPAGLIRAGCYIENKGHLGLCPAGTWSDAGASSEAQCTVVSGADKGRSVAYLAPGDKVATPCPDGCTAPSNATSGTQCTVLSGPSKGRSCAYLTPGFMHAKACPGLPVFAALQGVTSAAQCTMT